MEQNAEQLIRAFNWHSHSWPAQTGTMGTDNSARARSWMAGRFFDSRMQLLQIGAYQVDQVLGEFGGDLFFGAVHQVEANVCFQHLGHQAVHAAADRGKKHQLVAAVGIGRQRALDSIELPAQSAEALQQLHFFPFVKRHGIPSLLDNTHRGYGIQ